MARSRAARRGTQRERSKKNVMIVSAVIGAVLVLAAGVTTAIVLGTNKADAVSADAVSLSAELLAQETTTDAPTIAPDAGSALVEVPDVVGMQVEDAETLLAIAGFSVMRMATPAGDVATGTVLAQTPEAGNKVGAGEEVTVVYADNEATENEPGGTVVVCIDPGHQAQANLDTEPVGPGANDTKPKVTGGATGAVTKQPEHELALAISLKLKERLEDAGITVVMTRVAAEVDISNRQRAEVANKADAALFVRIHADGSTNGDTKGISTLYPGGNSWVAPIEARSLRAATLVQNALVTATKAQDRGLSERGDIAGFNWSKVPSILVETGFLSSPVEDKLLATEEYRDTVADGIAKGILAYLGLE